MQADRLAAGFNLAGVRDHVQPAEDSRQLVERDAAGGHFRQRDIDVDLLRIAPPDSDFTDAGNQHQLAAQLLGVANQFRIGKALTRDSKEEAKDIAKIVIDKWGRPREETDGRRPTRRRQFIQICGSSLEW